MSSFGWDSSESRPVTAFGAFFTLVSYKKSNELEQLKEQLPESVVKVVIELEIFDFKRESEKENSGKIVLIKLAERLRNMRTIEFVKRREWKRRAEETIRLFWLWQEELKMKN